MPENVQNTGFWVKAGLYALGVLLGICAKLATMRRTQEVTVKDIVIETSIAAAASYFVWAFFHFKLKEDDIAIIASVIVGRFGDRILLGAIAKIEEYFTKNKSEK